MNYILEGKIPKKVDLLTWAKWFKTANRYVNKTEINDVKISTVFLGIDHGFGGIILLFETMIFGGKNDGYQERYKTWEQAEKGHLKAVNLVKDEKNSD